ncbi:COG1361 S-layer family protein [Geoglobus acetivorans]|uniref:S-layer domain protein n=1 Tax=Geoglobus acetivorans TaxID=565033 RepID=A0A0A7GAK0_GEOAI|nr:S-layer domain protein [Geoglobus acetivorans]
MRKVIFILTAIMLALVTDAGAVSVDYTVNPSTPHPGDVFTIGVFVSSQGSVLRDLKITFMEQEENLAILKDGEEVSRLTRDVGDVYGNAKTSINLIAHSGGVYNLRVKVVYDYGTKSFEEVLSIRVLEKPSFRVSQYTIPELFPGSQSNVSFSILNSGGKARNLVAELVTPKGIISSGKIEKDAVDKGEAFNLMFNLSAVQSLKPDIYPMTLSLRFEDTFGNPYSENYSFSVRVEAKPAVIISDISTNPDSIYPGDSFTLSVTIQNSGKGKAENVRAVLSYPAGFSGETEGFAGDIESGTAKTVNFRIKVSKDVESGTYPFKLSVYSDSLGEVKEFEFSIFVNDFGDIDLEISGIYFSERPLTGSEFTLSFQLENVGQQTAKAVSIELELPDGFEGRNQYFTGTIEGGDSATASFDLKAPENPGDYIIRAKISYLDSRYERHEVERTFTLHVYSTESMGALYAGVLAVILVIAATLLWRRSKK